MSKKDQPTVEVEKTVVTYDPRTLTIGELIDFADVVGLELDECRRYVPMVDAKGRPVLDEDGEQKISVRLTTKGLHAIIWLMRRREDPSYTIEQARAVAQGHLVVEVPQEPRDPQHSASD